MVSDQSLPPVAAHGVPARWRDVRLRDLAWLARYGWCASCELAQARRRFGHLQVGDLLARNRELAQQSAEGVAPDAQFPARVAFIVPRLAPFMPFRSDCLIQAIAAQTWLARSGLPSRIVIGVERPRDGPFAAHAWLEHDGMIITGGDVSQYTVLL